MSSQPAPSTREPSSAAKVPVDPVVRRLREMREAEGWTQADIAALVGVSRAQIANAEAGKTDMPLGRIRRWCDALGLNLEVRLDRR